MYQSPQNQQNWQNQPNWQNSQQHPNFYYDQTQAGRFMAPPPPPARKPGLGGWWKRRRRGTKIVLGCLSVPVILFTLLFCTAAYQAATGQVSTSTPTVGPSIAQVAKVTPTQVPPTPTATPVPQPTATATPVPQATQAPQVQATQPPAPQTQPMKAPVQKATQPPAPQQQPTQAPPVKTGVNGNPWGYDYNSNGGQLIYNPPTNFCTAGYFSCIDSFWKGRGYVEQCQDGEFSKSGGIQGSCSHHGGNKQPLYAH